MKIYCVFFVDDFGCFVLQGMFLSQEKAERFAVECDTGNVEYFVEARWVS